VGDALWSDTGSRAEMDLGPAVVRVDARSSVALLDLSDRAIQLRLDAGSVDISVNDASGSGAFEIDAPNAAVLLLRAGEYRLSVDNAGNTSVAVRSGQATVQSGDQQTMNLATGQRGFYGMNGSYAVAQAGAPDDFDRWSQQRQAHWTTIRPWRSTCPATWSAMRISTTMGSGNRSPTMGPSGFRRRWR